MSFEYWSRPIGTNCAYCPSHSRSWSCIGVSITAPGAIAFTRTPAVATSCAGDVALDGQRLAAPGADLLGDVLRGLAVPVVDDDVAAARGERVGELPAHPRAAAGDHRRLAVDAEERLRVDDGFDLDRAHPLPP